MATIKVKHPVREAFSDCSSGSGPYYETKGHAVNAFDAALQEHDFCFDPDELIDFYGDEGRRTINIRSDGGEYVGLALLTWYRMPSGRYEFVGYIT